MNNKEWWDRSDDLKKVFRRQVKSRRGKNVASIFTKVINPDLTQAKIQFWDGTEEDFNLRDGAFYPQKPEN